MRNMTKILIGDAGRRLGEKIFSFLLIMLPFAGIHAQERQFNYQISLTGFAASGERLPFWLTANQHGLIPDGDGGMLRLGVFSNFTAAHKIQFAYGVAAAASLSEADDDVVVDQLYVSGRWRNLRLDVGMIHPEEEYNGVSSTNGNFVLSGNARSLPGYNLRSDYMKIPGTNGIVNLRFNWADYKMIDDRYVENTLVHNKSLFVKFVPHRRWEIIVGLEHWAQWGGDSPSEGEQPATIKDYWKIVRAKAGGSGATRSDSLNALGNHLGREHLRINYHADNYILTFYHDIPWDDASGTDFRSFPDGTYSLYYGSVDRTRWVTDVIYEFYYTKYQSGSRHDRPATPEEIAEQDPDDPFYGRRVIGGCDNYFNNGIYRSGWTYYRRTIGSPLMTAATGDRLGIVNNRVIGHHVGIRGMAFHKVPYKAMLTYTINYGTYGSKLLEAPRQLSGLLCVGIPAKRLPFRIEAGVYADYGSFLQDNIGLTLKITRQGKLN